MLFDVAKGLARRVPLTKLVALDGDIRPYLASLMVSALHRAGDTLVVPTDLAVEKVTREVFEAMMAEKSGKTYDQYGTIASGLGGTDTTAEGAISHQMARLEGMLGDVVKTFNKGAMPGGRQLMEGSGDSTGDSQMAPVAGAYTVAAVDRFRHAVSAVAKLVESKVPAVTASVVAKATSHATAGNLVIKQVRRDAEKLGSAAVVP